MLKAYMYDFNNLSYETKFNQEVGQMGGDR